MMLYGCCGLLSQISGMFVEKNPKLSQKLWFEMQTLIGWLTSFYFWAASPFLKDVEQKIDDDVENMQCE
jgi:hypothetical protein